jgi:hypothetical protein
LLFDCFVLFVLIVGVFVLFVCCLFVCWLVGLFVCLLHVPQVSPNPFACRPVGYMPVVQTSGQSSAHRPATTSVSSSMIPEVSDNAAPDLSDDASLTAPEEL